MSITSRFAASVWLFVFVVLGVSFIVLGFAVDGSSEVGHHLGFILGGAAIGTGITKSLK